MKRLKQKVVMSSCEFDNQAGLYHDGELPPDQRAEFERHLGDCAACTAQLRYLQAFAQSLRAMPRPTTSVQFMARLEALAEQVQETTVWRFAIRLTAAAVAILVLATCQWALHSQPAAPVSPAYADLGSEERLIVDPDSAIRNAGSDASLDAAASVDGHMEQVALDLAGGHP